MLQDALTVLATVLEIAIAATVLYGAFAHKPEVYVTAVQPAATVELEPVKTPSNPIISRTEQLRAKFGTTLSPKASIAPHLTVADVETALALFSTAPQVPTIEELQDLGIRALRKMAKGKCPGLATATKSRLIEQLCSNRSVMTARGTD